MARALSKRSKTFQQAYLCGLKDAINWLHNRAAKMEDPHAVQILNSAAFCLGNEKHWALERTSEIGERRYRSHQEMCAKFVAALRDPVTP